MPLRPIQMRPSAVLAAKHPESANAMDRINAGERLSVSEVPKGVLAENHQV